MALTNPSAPPIVTLSEDPSLVDLLTDNFLVTAGAKEKFTLTFNAAAVQYETIGFSWGANGRSFICMDSPDNSGTQFPSQTGTLEDFVQNLYDIFVSNYLLYADFDITISGSQLVITFEARNNGTDYDTIVNIDGSWDHDA